MNGRKRKAQALGNGLGVNGALFQGEGVALRLMETDTKVNS
jgi:hypothetical protein